MPTWHDSVTDMGTCARLTLGLCLDDSVLSQDSDSVKRAPCIDPAGPVATDLRRVWSVLHAGWGRRSWKGMPQGAPQSWEAFRTGLALSFDADAADARTLSPERGVPPSVMMARASPPAPSTTARPQSCQAFCSEPCAKLNGDVLEECGACSPEVTCSPGAPGFPSATSSNATDVGSEGPGAAGEGFYSCERLSGEISADEFWALMSSDPRPRLLTGGPTADVVSEFGSPLADGGMSFTGLLPISRETPFRITTLPEVPEDLVAQSAFGSLPTRFPLPRALRQVRQVPTVSFGLEGPAQERLGTHVHGLSALLLLQGEKLWALKPPDTPDCHSNHAPSACPPELDLCAFHSNGSAPAPACVQRPGETLVIPDGWFHATCNNAKWTAGWGALGRTWKLLGGTVGQQRFATVADSPFFTLADTNSLEAELGRQRRSHAASLSGSMSSGREQRARDEEHGWDLGSSPSSPKPALQAMQFGLTSLWMQFLGVMTAAPRLVLNETSFSCRLFILTPRAASELLTVPARMRWPGHLHFVAGVRGALTLHFGDRRHQLTKLDAAVWEGDGLGRKASTHATEESMMLHCMVVPRPQRDIDKDDGPDKLVRRVRDGEELMPAEASPAQHEEL